MSNPDNNNQSLDTGVPDSDIQNALWDNFVKKWKDFNKNMKLLLGWMASGVKEGLLFALFLSIIFTPLLFYVFNAHILDYDSYFTPQIKELSDKQGVVVGADNTTRYTITRDPQKMEAPQKDDNNTQNSVKEGVVKSDEKGVAKDTKGGTYKEQNRKEYCYTVKKDGQELYTVIIRSHDEEDVQKLTINVKKAKSDKAAAPAESNGNSTDEILWNETSNIAHSRSIFEIATRYKVLKSPSYPTSITAFISWLKEYGKGKKYLDLSAVSDNDNEIIASKLELILEDDWKFQKKNDIRILFFRSVNGGIQFLCVVLFNTIVVLLIARNIVVLFFDPLHPNEIIKDQKSCEEKVREYFKTWGMESPMLTMWRLALSQKKNISETEISEPDNHKHWNLHHNKYVSLTDITEWVKNSIQSSFSYISFLEDTIPALGFVGTIIGIGKTMLNTSAVISNEIGKQQSRISDVSLDLAFAFDTTLIALLLSMVIGFLITIEMRQEENRILNVAEDIINGDLEDIDPDSNG
ncbi:MAG: MotA/TolQ/ExbB proton channel family protein [Thermoguttaceae bacterium]|nr:MotA/TolQ/ExbB proton channel family protein [Thermoguttaceae bacterium]